VASPTLDDDLRLAQSVENLAVEQLIAKIRASVDFDAFGRIYEYFLGEFVRTTGPEERRVLHAGEHRQIATRLCLDCICS
jgi:hypothetical protein